MANRGYVEAHEHKHVSGHVAAGSTQLHDILANGNYPASGSYIDVSDVERVHIQILLGEIADAITFTVKEAESVSGTVDVIDATYATHTIGASDDNEFVTFTIVVSELSLDHHFLTVVVSGVSGSNYAAITYHLDVNSKPASLQAAALTTLPLASIHVVDGSA